jgi:hypothetical protein
VKAETIDKRDQRRQDNRQKQPWPLSQIHKFDKGTASPTRASIYSHERRT